MTEFVYGSIEGGGTQNTSRPHGAQGSDVASADLTPSDLDSLDIVCRCGHAKARHGARRRQGRPPKHEGACTVGDCWLYRRCMYFRPTSLRLSDLPGHSPGQHEKSTEDSK